MSMAQKATTLAQNRRSEAAKIGNSMEGSA
jgi:hypothetical protein